jgi:GTP-binding protein EngB required for normal cell division
MAAWFKSTGPRGHVANKCDKLKKSEIEPKPPTIRETLDMPRSTRYIPFPGKGRAGRSCSAALELE